MNQFLIEYELYGVTHKETVVANSKEEAIRDLKKTCNVLNENISNFKVLDVLQVLHD